MCGISGLYGLRDEPVPDVLGAMNAALVHRGPDDAGVHEEPRAGLALRRLSIIGVRNGRQPLYSEDRSVVLVLNGEIYNHESLRRELRERGHQLATQSDAEVAVHLYEECGDAFLERLRGMFALALYDRARKRLLLARDRLGKKPLYYAQRNGLLVFASEIKALHASGLVAEGLERRAVRSFLSLGFVAGTETLFEGVRKLPAGCALVAEAGQIRWHPYWDLPSEPGPEVGIDAAARRVRELLEQAVSDRLMSEVPLGAFLSGGADSSAVVGLMASRMRQPVETFSVGFGDERLDELSHARSIAEHFGTRHAEVVVPGCDPALLRDINWFQDEPAGDPASVPTFCLAKFARRRVTVVLTGEGGDEIFAGYRHHRLCRQLDRLEARLPGLAGGARAVGRWEPLLHRMAPPRFWKGAWIGGLSPDRRTQSWSSSFTDAELQRLLEPEWILDRAWQDPRPFALLGGPAPGDGAGRSDGLRRLLYADIKLGLADHLLMKVDKMTMAASLEARCPLLDQELVEYAWALPNELLLSEQGSKRVFRLAVRDLVPQRILDRPKHGFDVPLDTWLLRDLAGLVSTCLLDLPPGLRGLFRPGGVRDLWSGFERRRDGRHAAQLWRLLNLAVWHEIHWPTGRLADLAGSTPLRASSPGAPAADADQQHGRE